MSKISFEDFIDTKKNKKEIDPNEWDGKSMELKDQILHRPDTYIGTTMNKERTDYIYSDEEEKIISKNIIGNRGLERFIEEILSNVIDNKTRSEEKGIKMTKIKVKLEKDNKNNIKFTVWNNGKTIPIKIFKGTNKYNPEMAFFTLLVSENYNDKNIRKTSGRNGYGAKLLAIFSKYVQIRTYDKNQKLLYTQTCVDNMSIINKPIIEKKSEVKLDKDELNGFTEISWITDLSHFEMKSYSEDILSLFKRFCFDCSMVSKTPLYFTGLNGKEELLPIKDLISYSSLYTKEKEEEVEDEEDDGEEKKKRKKVNETMSFSCVEKKTKKNEDGEDEEYENISEVVLIPSNGKEFEQVSFVNGCYTPDGGVHVDEWVEQIFRPIVEKINSKGTRKPKEEKKKAKKKVVKKERPKINIKDVKNNFMIFVNSWLDQPRFGDQSKSELTYPKMTITVPEKNITKLMKWSFVDRIEQLIKMKEFMSLKTTQAKKGEVILLSGYDKANKAGKEPGCILAVCEGLSAKSTLSGGLSVGFLGKKGRDYIGLYAVQGKILNCRNAKSAQIAKNKEIVGLIKILKLVYEEDYSDDEKFNKLPYHKVCIFTDADDDGIHITGLLINLFDALFPSLLKRDFLYIMNTPILSVEKHKGEPVKMFCDQRIGKEYINENNLPKDILKYYKGLGSWESKKFKEICGKNLSRLKLDKDSKKLINIAFNKKFTDVRKKWVCDKTEYLSFNSETGTEYKNKPIINELSISTFIQTSLVEFFKTLCRRSLPSLYDGLKESQRKILFGMFKNKLTFKKKSNKLVQVGSLITRDSNYHYGDDNLYETAGRMAQKFIGSNNIPLLYDDGSFGTRLNNKDMASARYIFTKLNYLTELIFKDIHLSQQIEEEGLFIEPEHYVPIIPMILVNGCIVGIGSGWSCSVPAHNVEDLIKWIKCWLKCNGKIIIIDGKNTEITEENQVSDENKEQFKMMETPELIPWYRNFTGEIEVLENKVITKGVINKYKKGYQITEIPVGMWIDSVKENFEKMEAKKEIKFTNNCSQKDENSIDFYIIPSDSKDSKKEINTKTLGLEKVIRTSNMVLFTDDRDINKYKTTDLIMDKYCKKRLEFYSLRKKFDLKELTENKIKINNKIKFINEYIEGRLIINKRKRKDVDIDLDKMGFDRIIEKKKMKKEDDEEKKDLNNKENKKTFKYLWELKLEHLTTEKMEKLKKELNNIEETIKSVKDKDEKEQWIEELDEFLVHYHKWLKMIS